MASLVNVLAREVDEWPEWNPGFAYCDGDGEIRFRVRAVRDFLPCEKVDLDDRGDIGYEAGQTTVTRAQWQAERDRIAANQQATKEAREIAAGNGTFYDSADAMCEALDASERARLLLDNQPQRDQKIKEFVELACGKKQLPYAFTEADIRAAFEAGANWMRGAVEAGAAEYVDKLKGLK